MSDRKYAPQGQSVVGYSYGSPDGTSWHGFAVVEIEPGALATLLTQFQSGALTAPDELPPAGDLPHFADWLTPSSISATESRSSSLQLFLRVIINSGVRVVQFRAWGVYDNWSDRIDGDVMKEIRALRDLHQDVFYDIMNSKIETDMARLCFRPR